MAHLKYVCKELLCENILSLQLYKELFGKLCIPCENNHAKMTKYTIPKLQIIFFKIPINQ